MLYVRFHTCGHLHVIVGSKKENVGKRTDANHGTSGPIR